MKFPFRYQFATSALLYPSISEQQIRTKSPVEELPTEIQEGLTPPASERFLPSHPGHDLFGDKSSIERSPGSQATVNVQMLAPKLVPKIQALKNVINPSCMYHLWGSLVTTGRLWSCQQ